jgi:hypothetical protein
MRRSAVSLVFVLLAAQASLTQGNAQHVHEPHALFISRVHAGTEVLLCQYPSLWRVSRTWRNHMIHSILAP